jgi:hypothetical protein
MHHPLSAEYQVQRIHEEIKSLSFLSLPLKHINCEFFVQNLGIWVASDAICQFCQFDSCQI